MFYLFFIICDQATLLYSYASEKKVCVVTLACDGYHQLKAHKKVKMPGTLSKERRFLSDTEIAEQMTGNADSDVDLDDIDELNGGEDGWPEDVEDTEQADDDNDSDDDNATEENLIEYGSGPITKMRRLLKDKLVCSLEQSLNPDNYSPIELPTEDVEVSAVLVKKKRNVDEQRVTFQNYKRATVGRQGRADIIRTPGGVMDRAKDAKSQLDRFHLFMDPSTITDMRVRTNKIIYSLLESLTPAKRNKMKNKNVYASEEKIKAYLGLAFLRGYFQWNYWSAKKVWKSHPPTMTKNRFCFLNRHITLDEIETRDERWKLDRFTAVRDIFERFNTNCGTALQMGEYGAIDECQYATRMQVSFKTYNPSKPAKYGILLKCINEVKMPFTHRSEPFAGKPSVAGGEYYLDSKEAITLRLIDKVAEKQDLQGRNISMDNFYISIPLCQQMLDRGMSLVGTMRHNRVGLPKEIKSLVGREKGETEDDLDILCCPHKVKGDEECDCVEQPAAYSWPDKR